MWCTRLERLAWQRLWMPLEKVPSSFTPPPAVSVVWGSIRLRFAKPGSGFNALTVAIYVPDDGCSLLLLQHPPSVFDAGTGIPFSKISWDVQSAE